MTSEELAAVIAKVDSASDGASLRAALVNALRFLNEHGGNASTFGGHYPDYFCYRDDFLNYLKDCETLFKTLDENPKHNSTNLIHSGNAYNYINVLLNRLNNINGSSKRSLYIADALKKLNKIKENIADEINNIQSGTISSDDSFYSYAEKLIGLQKWELGVLEITQNTQDPITPERGVGWSVLNVNVQPVVKPGFINTEGDHEPPEGVDAWAPLVVSVPGLTEANAGSAYSGSSTSHGTAATEYDFASIVADRNGRYTASEQQKAAINHVDVQVTSEDPATLALKLFTVTFKNYDGHVLKVLTDVRGGTSAVYDGASLPTRPSDDGTVWTFSHWEPNPSYVDHDMECVAQYTKGLFSLQEIDTPWEDIVKGSGFGVGDIKVMNCGTFYDEYDYAGSHYRVGFNPGPIRMVCVYKYGEMNTNSTWLSIDLIDFAGLMNTQRRSLFYFSPVPQAGYYIGDGYKKNHRWVSQGDPAYYAAERLGWANAPLRAWLNYAFYEQCVPKMIRESIKPVEKATHTIWNTSTATTVVHEAYETAKAGDYTKYLNIPNGMIDGTNMEIDKIWIPSCKEVWPSYSKQFETSGDDVLNGASDNRTLCVEKGNTGYTTYTYDMEFGGYYDKDGTVQALWNNDRPAALKKIFYTDKDIHPAARHSYFYPFDEIPVNGRPHGLDADNNLIQSHYRKWPLRTFLGNLNMAMNQYGNSKNDFGRAANEQIQDSGCNLCRPDTMASYAEQRLGVCFGFCL